MKVNPYFKLRLSKLGRDEPASIVCEIKVKNSVSATPFATGITVIPKNWNYKERRILKQDSKARLENSILDNIEIDIKRLAENLHNQGKIVTAKLLHEKFNEKPVTALNFIDSVEAYIESRIKMGVSHGTKKQYHSYYNILSKYLNSINKSKIDIESFNIDKWGKLKDYTGRSELSNHVFLAFIKSVLKYSIKNKFITTHDLIMEENPKGDKKKLLWFDDGHLQKLLNHRYKYQHHERLRKAFLFQCFTGLAYEEIKVFKKSINIKILGGKETLYIYRKKVKSYFPVPLIKQAKEILQEIDESFHIPTNFEYNLSVRFLGEVMEYEDIEQISSHMGRKTAGVYLINNGVPIEVVSKILGHSNIQTTQEYYSTVLTKYIDNATLHLQ